MAWHVDAAVAARQPVRNAFTHIGLYLAWLIRRDLVDETAFDRDRLRLVREGVLSGTDLMDDVDEKLVSALMTQEGQEFSDARYDEYLRKYERTFADVTEYGVEEDGETSATVSALLDEMFSAWLAAGRPTALPHPPVRPAIAPRVWSPEEIQHLREAGQKGNLRDQLARGPRRRR